MGNHRQHSRLLRPLLLCLFGLSLFTLQGCALLPFAATTAASFAMPQTASLAMSGAKAVHRTAFVASDERDVNTILRDNMLTLKAKSALLTDSHATNVNVYAYTGDVFAVGVVETDEDRDRVINVLQAIKGVDHVKGIIRLKSPSGAGTLADAGLTNFARIAVGRYLLHKNSGVDIQAVQGELCLLGVVGTHAEALDLIQYVESVSGARALSMLAIHDEYAAGRPETNRRYLLTPSYATRPALLAAEPLVLPTTPIAIASSPMQLSPEPSPAEQPVWNKVRHKLSTRLQAQAQREKNSQARNELLTLAAQIGTDHELSISDRLSVAAAQVKTPHVKATVQALLAQY